MQEGREEGLEMWLAAQLEWEGVGIKVPFVNPTGSLMFGGLTAGLRVWSRAGRASPPSLLLSLLSSAFSCSVGQTCLLTLSYISQLLPQEIWLIYPLAQASQVAQR